MARFKREELPEALQELDDEELEEALEDMRPGQRRIAPRGKYRVLGVDMFQWPTEDAWVVGDYDSREEALKVARERNKGAAGGVLDPDDDKLTMINRYYAYDDRGNYIGGDIHAGE